MIGHLQSGVRLENVVFGYAPQEPPVLQGISLEIPRGRVTAVVGTSGAGKSTLAALVMRLHDPTSGRITIDGFDLREFDPVRWRQQLAIVSQDVFLFHASVQENLRFARPDASDEQIREACRTAAAHDFIMELPHGYDTVLQERGLRLSGGQRQRIALARALLVEAEILILDEATSEIDAVTERAIHHALWQHVTNRTVLIIAHRLSTVQNADRIYVLRHGRILEEGTHEELLRAGGAYAAMINLPENAPRA